MTKKRKFLSRVISFWMLIHYDINSSLNTTWHTERDKENALCHILQNLIFADFGKQYFDDNNINRHYYIIYSIPVKKDKKLTYYEKRKRPRSDMKSNWILKLHRRTDVTHSNLKYDFLGLIQFFSYCSFYQLTAGRQVTTKQWLATERNIASSEIFNKFIFNSKYIDKDSMRFILKRYFLNYFTWYKNIKTE